MFPARSSLGALFALAGCAAPPGSGPSLAPRAAEALDPRVPVVPGGVQRPVDPALASRLAALIGLARAGDSDFSTAIAAAERLAASAGAPQTEGWVLAQQALSAAVSARAPTTRALGDIDALAAAALAAQGGIAPASLAAIEAAAAQVGAIDRRQARAVDALQARLGS